MGLAPVVRLHNTNNMAMQYAAQLIDPFATTIQMLGMYDIMSLGMTPKWFFGRMCQPFPRICQLFDEDIIDWTG